MDNKLFPMQPWEYTAVAASGLSHSQLRFAVSFLASIVVAIILRLLSNPTARHWYAVITGFFLIYYPFGNGCFHVIAPSLLTYIFMYKFRQYSGTLTWMVVFPYLIVNHVSEASGIMWKEGAMDFTGAQMILTLKLIAIAICYQDGARDQSSLHAYAKAKSLNRLPSPLEYISYLLSAGNLLAGPFYEAKDYFDYMQRKGEWDQSKPEYRLPNPIVPGLLRFIKAFACLAIWFSLSQRYGVEFLESKEWREETPLPRRVLLLWACLVIYRFKYYFAWALAECGLIFSGLCFNGYDDKGTPQWNRCINARIRKVELNESLADLPRHWNISTGNWLRNYVYERLPGRDGKPTFANMFVTQLVSGLWHGLFPGYWMMFISTAFMFDSSKMLYRYEQNWSPALRAFPLYRLFKIVLTATVLDYTAAPFMILSFQESWLVWKSVYFFGHIFIFVVMLVGMVMPPRRKKSKGTETQSATELKTE